MLQEVAEPAITLAVSGLKHGMRYAPSALSRRAGQVGAVRGAIVALAMAHCGAPILSHC